jgi:hypothetical protein
MAVRSVIGDVPYPGPAREEQEICPQRQLIRAGRGTHLTQVPHDRQAHQGLLAFTDSARSVLETIVLGNPKSRQKTAPARQEEEPLVQGLERLKGPQGSLGII